MRPYPPVLFGGGLLLALVGHLVHPLALPGGWWLRGAGVVLVVVGGAIAVAAEREFTRARTPLMPFQDATWLLRNGVMHARAARHAIGSVPCVWRVAASTPIPRLSATATTSLVTTGPFRFSRNPIYLAFCLGTCAIALLTASWWPLILLPLPFLGITWVIRGEEERLQRIFGADYTTYRARTRRWL